MSGFLCSMVGASFTVAAAAEVLRRKKGITAVGNAQIDTAQSQFGGASALFDGTGDYLTVSTGADLTDLTVELWYRAATLPGSGLVPLISFNNTLMYIGYAGGTCYDFYNGGSKVALNAVTINTGTWYHVAFVRSGSSITVYHNGTSVATGTFATAIDWATYGAEIAKYSTYFLNGHMDEVRISNTARYTTGFTPSTTPFVNDANTLLLIHADGTDASTFFEDDNGTGRSQVGIIGVSTAQIDTAQSKFGGSSLYLDGNWSTTNAMLNVGNSSNIPITSGNWTIECWIRLPAANLAGLIFDFRGNSNNIVLYHVNTDLIFFAFGSARITASSALSANTWHHVAVSKSGSSTKMFIDGTQGGSTYTDNNTYTASGVGIGTSFESAGGSSNYEGWIDEVRVSNSARYTTTFTPSTTPFVNDANTLVLIHMDGTDATTVFRDDNGVGRSPAGLYRENGPVISTAQSKFGGSSLYFAETSGQAIQAKFDTTAMGLTSGGDFTAELWAYWTKLPSSGDAGYMMFYSTSPEPYILMQNGGVYLGAGGYPSFATTFTTSTWYHIAVSRSSGNLRCFVNGTQIGSTVTGSTYNYIPVGNQTGVRFGKFGDDRGRWQGYMDEIRFSKTARYTANFTAPTAPFQNDADTLLLIHGDGTNNSTVFIDDNGTRPV